MELFQSMRGNYQTAAQNLWLWYRRQYSLLKWLIWPWPLLVGSVLGLIGGVFALLSVLDGLARWLRRRREAVVSRLENSANRLCWYKSAYFTAPLVGLFWFPLGILLGLFPKFSSEVDSGDADVNHGFFFRLAKAYLLLGKNLLTCSLRHGVLFFPIALLIAGFTAPVAVMAGLFFLVFILLDAIGFLVDLLRQGVVNSSRVLARGTDSNLFTALALPLLLILLFPVYLLLLLIPKISTYDSGS